VDREDNRRAIEEPLREAAGAGDFQRVATEALRLYGGELFGYLCSVARDEDVASDAFGLTCEKLWRGLPAFRWEASLRSWLYTVARHELWALRAHPSRRADRIAGASQLEELAAKIRTETLPMHRTEVREGVRALRAELSPEDSELVLLRIDRQMSWRDIARITGDEGDLTRQSAALRKRFERAKERLKQLAIERGLVST
jgi:RNA polymerase sigma-70 factor (ECF subfamily)